MWGIRTLMVGRRARLCERSRGCKPMHCSVRHAVATGIAACAIAAHFFRAGRGVETVWMLYLTVSAAVGAPSVTFPVSWLSWYVKMLPPPTGLRPVTFDITVESASSTKAPEPCDRMPLAPLRSDDER